MVGELMDKHLYPIYIDMENKPCLVVGGGTVAERKVDSLLEHKAQVLLVSPQVTNSLETYAKNGLIIWENRIFKTNDLDNIFLVYIATNDTLVNQVIAEECKARKILVNAVDDPPNCDFYVPAILRRGSLAMAISTEGKSPMLARHLRLQLEKQFTEAYGEYVDLLGESRDYIKNNISDIEIRQKIFLELVNSDILDLLKMGEREKARGRIEECISLWQD